MVFPDVVKEESCGSFGGDSGVSRREVGLFTCKIDDVHDRVVAVGLGEFADEVDTDDVPRCVGNGQGVKFAVGFMA